MRILHDSESIPKISPDEWYLYASRKRLPNGKHFNFNDSHYPWEFPFISDLAKKTRVSYNELDYDSDILFEDIFIKLWVKDILNRTDDFNNGIVLLSQLISKKQNNLDKLENDYFIKNKKLNEYDPDCSKDIFCYRETKEQESLYNNYCLEVEKEKTSLQPFYKKFIIELSKSNYSASRAIVKEWVSIYKKDLLLEYPEYSLDSLESLVIKSEGSYLYHIFRYPVANLPYYFYDELVFMGYIQTIIEHDDRIKEKPFIDSFMNTPKVLWLENFLNSDLGYS